MNTRTLTVERSTSTAHRLATYDGVCGNIHGHNMVWHVEATVSMEDVGESNMPVDLKDISGRIDETDHAVILSREDDLLRMVFEQNGWSTTELDNQEPGANGFITSGKFPPLGEVHVFDSDPTCEVIAQWMADKLERELDAVVEATVEVRETRKYGITSN